MIQCFDIAPTKPKDVMLPASYTWPNKYNALVLLKLFKLIRQVLPSALLTPERCSLEATVSVASNQNRFYKKDFKID